MLMLLCPMQSSGSLKAWSIFLAGANPRWQPERKKRQRRQQRSPTTRRARAAAAPWGT
ncbi:unnamed protein product, partial [Heterosigma akashiwo]